MMLIKAGQSITQSIRDNPSVNEFTLEPAVYEENILFNRSNIALRGSGVIHSSTSLIIPPTVNGITFDGLTFRCGLRSNNIISLLSPNAQFKSCQILGNAVDGQHRGIAVNSSNCLIKDTLIDYIFLPDQDAQAICGWDGTENLWIENCDLLASGQSVMFGGSDPKDQFSIPTNITMTNCRLSKRSEWLSSSQVKCSLELKNCINFHARGCSFQYAGISQGQGAFLLVMTPRNQGGHASYSTIQNVLIEDSTGRLGGGVATFLGSDDGHVSDVLRGVTIRNCNFTEIGAMGAKRAFQFARIPQNVNLENVTVAGKDLNSGAYFIGPPPINLRIKNVRVPKSKYGIKIDAGGSGLDVLKQYAPFAVIDQFIESDSPFG